MPNKQRRYFNTSGPNIISQHYTLMRESLIEEGKKLVNGDRYFTIPDPRQTGKSTYFRLLADSLTKDGYTIFHTNVENFKSANETSFLKILADEFKRKIDINITALTFSEFHNQLAKITNKKLIMIIDEIEGLNEEIFNQFLHTIRNLYHSRQSHSLKSVILVDVSNIVGIVKDNASPFNIADNLEVPYFSDKETRELPGMHEAAMVYSFESFIQVLLDTLEGKSYLDPHTGLGNSDLVINGAGIETVVEFKIYRDQIRYERGKKQLAAYCKSLNLNEGIYLVFIPNYYKELNIEEVNTTIDDVYIRSYNIWYDEEKDF